MTIARKTLDQAIEAALALAADRPWSSLTLAAIAEQAGLPLSDLHGLTREDIGEAVDGFLDRAMSAEDMPEDGPAREKLFDVIMRRFEFMERYREGLSAFLRFRETSLVHVVRLPQHRHDSAAWALASAGLDDDLGAPASLKRIAVALVIAESERAWRRETSADLARTMAALDRGLRRMEERLGQLRRFTGRRGQPAEDATA